MVESLQTAAQLTTVIEVDVTKVAALRARSKDAFLATHGTKLTFLPFFVKAATEALAYHPKINATINDKEVTYFDHEHVGIAVDTPRGLLVPVMKNAGEKDIPAIAASINDLAARTRDSKIGPDELSGSTFTVTNTGSGGALVLQAPPTDDRQSGWVAAAGQRGLVQGAGPAPSNIRAGQSNRFPVHGAKDVRFGEIIKFSVKS